MSVGEFLQYVGDRSLEEMSYRVALANALEKTLDEVGQISSVEMTDWILLLDVEAEYAAQQAENAERRGGD